MEFAAAIFWQSRGPILQLLLIYAALCTIPLGLGTVLLFAPRRGGNFLNEAFAIFPAVKQHDLFKKLWYRALGVGLISVSVFYIHQIYFSIAVPLVHFFRSST